MTFIKTVIFKILCLIKKRFTNKIFESKEYINFE